MTGLRKVFIKLLYQVAINCGPFPGRGLLSMPACVAADA